MVEDEISDGDRIASLLEAEIEGLADPPFDGLVIQQPAGGDDGNPDGEPMSEPGFAATYEETLAFEVGIQPDRIYLEFKTVQADARAAAEDAGLRVRPKATRPPATLVFVERGADVKRAIDVLRASLPPQ